MPAAVPMTWWAGARPLPRELCEWGKLTDVRQKRRSAGEQEPALWLQRRMNLPCCTLAVGITVWRGFIIRTCIWEGKRSTQTQGFPWPWLPGQESPRWVIISLSPRLLACLPDQTLGQVRGHLLFCTVLCDTVFLFLCLPSFHSLLL